MPYSEFVYWWQIGYAVAVAVVLIVAILLAVILFAASSIERLARTALHVAGEIETSTRPIWALADANALIEEIVVAVRRADAHAAAVAESLAGRPR